MNTSPAGNTKVMNRFDLTSRLVAKLKNEEAVVGGIGNTNFDLWATGQRPQNFYMLGSMGLTFPIALGVALAQPKRRVIALDSADTLAALVADMAQPGDYVVCLGAGSITQWAYALPAELAAMAR